VTWSVFFLTLPSIRLSELPQTSSGCRSLTRLGQVHALVSFDVLPWSAFSPFLGRANPCVLFLNPMSFPPDADAGNFRRYASDIAPCPFAGSIRLTLFFFLRSETTSFFSGSTVLAFIVADVFPSGPWPKDPLSLQSYPGFQHCPRQRD